MDSARLTSAQRADGVGRPSLAALLRVGTCHDCQNQTHDLWLATHPNEAAPNIAAPLDMAEERIICTLFVHLTPYHDRIVLQFTRWRTPDLNLLVTLDVLLAEGSVARAARRLRLSPSAMSRALARSARRRPATRCWSGPGRGLVPTPRAIELREQSQPARAGRRSGAAACRERSISSSLVRTFTLRTSEGLCREFRTGI